MGDWIDYNKSWSDFRDLYESDRDYVGMQVQIIEDNDRSSIRTLLIGDINALGGICDDCMEFKYSKTLVMRYRTVIDREVLDG